jgi:DNA-binding transcriptional MerR regulator
VADEGLSAGAVARRLGVAVTTLRTWHQRYGLGPSQHLPGHHRRYTADDLARLEIMRRLTVEGVAPAEAARWASSAAVDTPAADTAPAGSVSGGRAGGGRVIPVGRAGPNARGLARAAMRLDVEAMRGLIERSVAKHGVVATWDTLVRPVLVGIGERHAATTALVEVEHLTSRTVSEVFAAVPRPVGRAPAVLLACADEEQHSLPLEALAAALAELGVPCRLFGARVPPGALRDAVARTGPVAVIVWAHLAQTADPAQLATLLAGPERPVLVAAGGPGWRAVDLPDGVVWLASLAEAITATTAADAASRL